MTSPQMDGRLGRRFAGHDEQNLGHLSRALLAQRQVERKDTYWRMPAYGRWPLDQDDTPECTGFGVSHEYACAPVEIPGVDAAFAHQRYLRNVATDRQMGNFFDGGATVEATMRASRDDGFISGWVWNLGADDTIDALCAVGPQVMGTVWTSGMFNPTRDGLLTMTGSAKGGHLWILVARVEKHPRWGPGCWMLNSWGQWGVGVPELGLVTGCAFVQDDTLARLLADDGESVAPRDLYVPPAPVSAFIATRRSTVFHRPSHPLIRADRRFAGYAEAVAAGLRPCKLCRPQP